MNFFSDSVLFWWSNDSFMTHSSRWKWYFGYLGHLCTMLLRAYSWHWMLSTENRDQWSICTNVMKLPKWIVTAIQFTYGRDRFRDENEPASGGWITNLKVGVLRICFARFFFPMISATLSIPVWTHLKPLGIARKWHVATPPVAAPQRDAICFERCKTRAMEISGSAFWTVDGSENPWNHHLDL